MARLLIGALSGIGLDARRTVCRRTWAKRTKEVDVVFLVGAGDAVNEPVRVDDLLLLPCPDDYRTLPQRTKWFCQWACGQEGWEYLFKCDDDTCVAVDRLAAYDLAGRDYVGAEWRPGVAYGSGGAGYFLSRKSAAVVAEHLFDVPGPEVDSKRGEFPNEFGSEDLIVGDCLKRYGILLSIENRLIPLPQIDRRFPAPDNNLITAHKGPLDRFRQAQADTSHRWPFRIVMPTSNAYAARVAPACIEMLRRNWPGAPGFDVISYDEWVPALPNVDQYWMRKQSETPWTEGLSRYLTRYNCDPLALLMLDDYAACGPVNVAELQRVAGVMLAEPRIGVVYLTWHQCPPAGEKHGLYRLPRWDYTVNTQAAIWRRDFLHYVLQMTGPTSIEQFELAGSQLFNDHPGAWEAYRVAIPDPAFVSPCLDDTDKSAWALPYHNLMKRGVVNGRWLAWAEAQGLSV